MKATLYDFLRKRTSPSVRRCLKRQKWFNSVLEAVFGNTAYSKSYYQSVEDLELASVPVIATWVRNELGPQNVLDVGCGPGHFIAALVKEGINVLGVDISAAAMEAVRHKNLPFMQHDLTNEYPLPLIDGRKWDLVTSFEVAEHLRPEFADNYLDKLCAVADRVMLTAAEPDANIGPGLYHYNEQKNDYWIQKMARRGFEYSSTSVLARDEFEKNGVISYLAKPMVFDRKRT
ncbi:class I SAM-dependent methyltransferase [Mesorhizobium sp.]|uniref:class I SAM-dependent methyltransferase n=1 Tax=Mesorhizobium sp. TaxID=1871066 RepID=UPI0012107479|nr:class I SAM-dependent methyltransferase [Mesorhizobium sp.]TIL46159.1 MAG: methyltransferase domain-containing protein [Mesorhizobium sp.]